MADTEMLSHKKKRAPLGKADCGEPYNDHHLLFRFQGFLVDIKVLG